MDAANPDYVQLTQLIALNDYEGAEVLCYAALSQGVNSHFWRTQLAYVCFLNDRDFEAYYNMVPTVFKSLVAEDPKDANALFWLSYIYNIVLFENEKAKYGLEQVLALEPNHPYANIALAGLTTPEAEHAEAAIKCLQNVLQQQPTNFRALRQLAGVFAQTSRTAEAQDLLQRILHYPAYVEHNYGIMNQYINDVLTGATHEQVWRHEAQLALELLK
jgi:tetratricopeptide (TPR) repeat protein